MGRGGYIIGALFTSPLAGLQSSFGYEMQKSRSGQRMESSTAGQLPVQPSPHCVRHSLLETHSVDVH